MLPTWAPCPSAESSGVSLQLEYSWNRSLDNTPIVGGPQNPNDMRSDRGNSDQVRRHICTAAYTSERQFGPGKKFLTVGGAAGKIAGGWVEALVSWPNKRSRKEGRHPVRGGGPLALCRATGARVQLRGLRGGLPAREGRRHFPRHHRRDQRRRQSGLYRQPGLEGRSGTAIRDAGDQGDYHVLPEFLARPATAAIAGSVRWMGVRAWPHGLGSGRIGRHVVGRVAPGILPVSGGVALGRRSEYRARAIES